MYCSNCGFKVCDDAAFCSKCGKQIHANGGRESYENKNEAVCEEEHEDKYENKPEEILEEMFESNYEAACEEKYGECRTATDDEWYCRKKVFVMPVLLSAIKIVLTIIFLCYSIFAAKYEILIPLGAALLLFFISYYYDIRLKRKVRYIIHIIEDVLAAILFALVIIWLCYTQKTVLFYLQNSCFSSSELTIKEGLEEKFKNVEWYSMESVADGGTIIYVRCDYRENKEIHKVDIKFVYEDLDMFSIDETSTVTMAYVKYDGRRLDDEEISELLGVFFDSNYSGASGNKDNDRFGHDIEAVKTMIYDGSNMTYEEAFYDIFIRCQWTAYDGMAYTPDDNYNGKWDSAMAVNDIVEFTGECNYGNEEVQMRFQFTQDDNGDYRPTYLEIDSVPQDSLTLEDIMLQICLPDIYYSNANNTETSTAYSDEYGWIFPCGVFGTDENSDAKVCIEYLGEGQYSVSINIYRFFSFDNLSGYTTNGGYELFVEGVDPNGNYISFVFPAITDGEILIIVDQSSFEGLPEGYMLMSYMY